MRTRSGGPLAALYAKARPDGDRSVRTEAFEAMATGEWELADSRWLETELLLWKPPTAWFSINAFFVPDGTGRRLRRRHITGERELLARVRSWQRTA